MSPIFIDTWAWVALGDARDSGHQAAIAADDWIHDQGLVMVTSDFILDETITGIHAGAGARAASAFIDMLEAQIAADELMLLPVSVARRREGLSWFKRLARDTPKLSFTDCTSFALMDELGIKLAFTADGHFAKAKSTQRLIHVEKDRLVFRAPVGY